MHTISKLNYVFMGKISMSEILIGSLVMTGLTEQEGAPTLLVGRGANIRFCQNFRKTAWNRENFGP